METIRVRHGVMGALLIGLWSVMGSGLVWAQTDPDEKQVRTEEEAIDKEATTTARPDRAAALAKQYDVPASTVEGMRAKGQGWGAITIELAMAQHLSKTDSKTYPTTTDGVTKVESLRSEGKGFGAVAKELGFKLGPVVSAAERTRHEMREERGERGEKHEKGEKEDERMEMEHRGRPEHPEHSERMERSERVERPERAERAER